ncbi:hypothetical protein [Ancrocorticia populi]|uniref:Uncharacterized protein n=1 Tax=Ancrocorticia populi TaxID=2175228 RepID=A0A2V1KA36_9ACTO|nr:hypothetical protein [Ancrocorticia populi]PWF26527.1 hypothetical protein DD236_06665 [Ancrocorticia populi]
MDGEIQIINDGDGLTLIGSETDIDEFLHSEGLSDVPSSTLNLQRLTPFMSTGATAAQAGTHLAENSGRWVRLTAESAEAIKKYNLISTDTPGVFHAMAGQRGSIAKWLQIDKAPGLLMAPTVLPALSAMMQQQALEQQMKNIERYLETIDEKVDDILRSQKDAVFSEMIGASLVIAEALVVRDRVGGVSDVTWSKVQSSSLTIAKTQAYALRQLDALAGKLKKKKDLSDISRVTKRVEPEVREWLAVLAKCIQLADAVAVLELDRILESTPEQLEKHREGLLASRDGRLEAISKTTAHLIASIEENIKRANARVLLNPFDSPTTVRASNRVGAGIVSFETQLGIESIHAAGEARRWRQAAGETKDKALQMSSESLAKAREVGDATLDRATQPFRPIDIDGDGIPDDPRAAVAARQAGAALKGAASGLSTAFSTFIETKPKESIEGADSPKALDSPTEE